MCGNKFNYRVLAVEEDDEILLQIHRVYYDENDIPIMYSEKPITIVEYSTKDLKKEIKRIKTSLSQPILYYGSRFPEIYKP